MNILVLSPIAMQSLCRLRAQHAVRVSLPPETPAAHDIACAEVVIIRSDRALPAEELARFRVLRAIIRAGSGLDNIDLDETKRRGIEVWRIGRTKRVPLRGGS